MLYDALLADWSPIFETVGIDVMVDTLNSNVIDLLEKHAPLRQYIKKSFNITKPWFTSEVRLSLIDRDIAFLKNIKEPIFLTI